MQRFPSRPPPAAQSLERPRAGRPVEAHLSPVRHGDAVTRVGTDRTEVRVRRGVLFRMLLGIAALALGVALWPGPGADARIHVAHPGDLVINEIDYDQPGVDEAEFIEILNTTDDPIFLAPYDLLGINGVSDPGTEYLRINLPDVTLGPGEYFVVGASGVPNVDLVLGGTSVIQNGAPDAVAIVESPQSDPAADVLIDSVSYEGDTTGGPPTGGSWTEGSGTGLDDSGNAADVDIGLSRVPDGVDTGVNNQDLTRRCITPGEPNAAAPSADCSGSAGPTATGVDPGDPPTATETPIASPTETETRVATETPAATTTATETAATPNAPTATETPVPTASATAVPSSTPILEPSPTSSPSPTPLSSASPTTAPSMTPTPSASPTPSPGATATAFSSPPLAIQLALFRADRMGRTALVTWRTTSEINHDAFHLYRSGGGAHIRLNPVPIPGRGDSLRGAEYAWVDSSPPDGKVAYWLVDVETSGLTTRHGPAHLPLRRASTPPQPHGVPQ